MRREAAAACPGTPTIMLSDDAEAAVMSCKPLIEAALRYGIEVLLPCAM